MGIFEIEVLRNILKTFERDFFTKKGDISLVFIIVFTLALDWY